MDVTCPNLVFRRINQEALSLDPDGRTEGMRSTVRSHCKGQLSTVSADSTNSYALVTERVKEQRRGASKRQVHRKLLPNG